jgi:hypothetical protein
LYPDASANLCKTVADSFGHRAKEVFNLVTSRWPKILEKKKPSREATDR